MSDNTLPAYIYGDIMQTANGERFDATIAARTPANGVAVTGASWFRQPDGSLVFEELALMQKSLREPVTEQAFLRCAVNEIDAMDAIILALQNGRTFDNNVRDEASFAAITDDMQKRFPGGISISEADARIVDPDPPALSPDFLQKLFGRLIPHQGAAFTKD
jgi:hypothetical protein